MISVFSEPKFHKIRGNWTIEPAADHSWRRIPVILALGIALAVPGRYWPPAERPSITFAVQQEPNGVDWEECKPIGGGNSVCTMAWPGTNVQYFFSSATGDETCLNAVWPSHATWTEK